MSKLTYAQQLKHPNWQRRRLERLSIADFECEDCGAKEVMLHVHHKQYFKGREVWEYGDTELAVLCEVCHSEEHDELDVLKVILSQTDTSQTLGLVSGFRPDVDWIARDVFDSGRDADPHAFAAGFIAFLSYGLDMNDKLKVAAFAASLLSFDAEAFQHFTYSRGNTFGEEA